VSDPTIATALTFDDVILRPQKSGIHPRDTDIASVFCRGIALNIPLVSAAMDTVTEADMAIAIAREGGIGVIHKNMSAERQAEQVDMVKRSESGMISNPITLSPKALVAEAQDLMRRFRISGVPITEGGKLVIYVQHDDLILGPVFFCANLQILEQLLNVFSRERVPRGR
jgi:IMP dehydrogenase